MNIAVVLILLIQTFAYVHENIPADYLVLGGTLGVNTGIVATLRWLPGRQTKGYAGQQALSLIAGVKSGSANIVFGKAFSIAPKTLLGIAGIESSPSIRFIFGLSLLSAFPDHISVSFTIGNETSISSLRVSYLGVIQSLKDLWVISNQQMEGLASCRLFTYLVAPIASGSGVRHVTVTFDYLAQTGRNRADSKVLVFTLGVTMTAGSDLGYSVTAVFVDSQHYALTLEVPNGCNILGLSFNTLLVDQTAIQSSATTYIDIGQAIASSGNWTSLVVDLKAVFTQGVIIGLNGFSYTGTTSPSFSFTSNSNALLSSGKTAFATLSLNYFNTRKRSCPTLQPNFSPIDSICYSSCPIGQEIDLIFSTCRACDCFSAARNTTQCPCQANETRVGLACNFTCSTCNGTTATDCLTCPGGTHRTFLPSNNSCPCDPGYFENGPTTCAVCNYTCTTCFGVSTNCTSCNTTKLRLISGTTCICSAGYFDNGVALCAACSYTCQTCTGAGISSCLSCPTSSFRVLSGLSCPCSSGYYDSGATVCSPCSYKCLNCTTGTTCTVCNSSNFRTLSSSQCVCNNGYYDNLVPLCVPCSYTCNTCTAGTATSCLSCSTTNRRTFLSGNSSCPCNAGYYDSGVGMCAACSYTCATCGSAATNCLTCSTSSFRTLFGSSCPCNSGYYDNLVPICLLCNYRCLTCMSGTATGCLTCSAANHRTLLGSNNSCPCDAGYYETGVSLCATCNYTCGTCTSLSACVTCLGSSYRTLSAGTCLCNVGYYDAGVKVCAACNDTCYMCTSATVCTACYSAAFRVLSPMNTCVCDIGYFDNSLAICGTCSYACVTCIGTSTNCTSCGAIYLRTFSSVTNSCPCNAGYFDNGTSLCAACSYTCLTCNSATMTGCTTCSASAFRTLIASNSSCPCGAGYYDIGASICAVCSYTCLSCINTNVNCTTCSPSAFRTFLATNNSCLCNTGYFDSGTSVCSACIVGCLTCTTSTDCTACDAAAGFILSVGVCVCQNGQIPVANACPSVTTCSTGCLNCNAVGCTSCDSANGYLLSGGSCVLCSSAMVGCLSCSSSSVCTLCDTANNFALSGTSCDCASGYYLSGGACAICSSMMTNCLSCSSSTVCTTCDVGYTVSNSACVGCGSIISGCLNCSSSSVCTSCDAANNFALSGTSCDCASGYYLSGSSCASCSSFMTGCATCSTSSFCLNCTTGYTITSTNQCAFSCAAVVGCTSCTSSGCQTCDSSHGFVLSGAICNCQSGSYLSGTTCALCSSSISNCVSCSSSAICSTCAAGFSLAAGNTSCVACPFGCLTCSSSSVCTLCDTANNFVLVGSLCQCSPSTYSASVGSCVACHYSCATCTGPLSTDCTSCDPLTGRTFAGSTCLCTVGSNDNGAASCGCLTGYTQNSLGVCQEICGDGLLYDLACDDGNTADGDGCSSTCTIEADYVCNTNPGTASICSYSKPITFTLVKTIKNMTSNSVAFSFVISPVIAALTSLNFSQVIQCSLNSLAQLSFSYDGSGALIVDAQYNQSIHGTDVSLQFVPSVQSVLFFATPNSNISFVVAPTNNIAANYFDPSVYDGVRTIQILSMVVMGLALAGFAAGLFTAKFIGVEMLGVVQVAFIGLAIVNNLPPLLAPLAKMGYVNGVNSALSGSDSSASTSLPVRESSLDYGASMVYSLNYTVALLLLPLLVSLALYIAAKCTKNDESKQQKLMGWSQTSLCEWGLTSVMFVLYHSTVSLLIFAFHGGEVTSVLLYASIGDALFTVGVTVAIAVLFKYRSQFFGDYKKAFKNDTLSQGHYWLLMGGRVLLAALLIGANAIDYVGFVAMVVPLAMLAYLGARRPYNLLYNNVRAIGNEAVLLVVLGIYGYYRAFVDHTMHSADSIVGVLPWVEVGLLLACIGANIVLMVKYRYDKNKLDTDNAKAEETAKVSKIEEEENMQFMEETKLRLKVLANSGSGGTPTRFSIRNSLGMGKAFSPEKFDIPKENAPAPDEVITAKTRLEEKLLNKKTVVMIQQTAFTQQEAQEINNAFDQI